MNKQPTPEIREEQAKDYAAIYALTERAFKGKPYAGGDEQDLVDRLRACGVLAPSLVAIIDKQIIGHIAFSPATVADRTSPWFALGPVSVLPEHQSKGIGAALIERGLDEIEKRGALGCILTGNPDYYQRFGFEFANANAPSNEPTEFFMLKLLSTSKPTGAFTFHPAFYGEVENHV